MKPLLYLLSLGTALMLFSCAENTMDEQADQVITFQVANYLSTRDDCAIPTLEGNTTFSATAYFHEGAWADAGITNVYMNDVTVSHQTSPADRWAPADTYYWPKTGKLSFWGYSPAGGAAATFDKTNGVVFTDFTVETTPSATPASGNKVNLMYSNEDASKNLVASDYSKTTYAHTGVPMLFHHALAKLNFRIVYKEVYYDAVGKTETPLNAAQKAFFTGAKVKSLKIYNLNYKGTFHSTPGTWTLTDDRLAYASKKTLNETETQIGDAPADADAGQPVTYATDYFVMPQTITGAGDDDTNIEIEYYILPQSSSTPETITAKMTLKTNDITSWSKNNIYTYTLVLTPVGQPILFDPSVETWDTVTAAPITVVP